VSEAMDGTNVPNETGTDTQTAMDLDLLALVQKNTWLVAVLCLTGMLTYGVTAYVGYPSDAPWVVTIFRPPWLFFGWFFVLLIVLEFAVLRDPPRRKYLARALTVTVISAILVALIYIGATDFLSEIRAALDNLLGQARGTALTYTVANFLPIAVFLALTLIRLFRRLRGQPPNPNNPQDVPSIPALLSGDLIAGGVIIAILMLIFRADTINSAIDLIKQLPAHPNWDHQTICTVSWPVVPSDYPKCELVHGGGGGLNDPPTLTFIDSVLMQISFAAGAGILAVSATIAAIGSLLHPGAQVIEVLVRALRTGLYRRYRVVIDLLWLVSRSILWIGFIFLGVAGIGFAARFNRLYLHFVSYQGECGQAIPAVTQACQNDLADFTCDGRWSQLGLCVPQNATQVPASPLDNLFLITTLGAGVIAVLAIVAAFGLLLSYEPVAGLVMLFVGRLAYAMLLVLWLYSIFFILLDRLLLLLPGVHRSPFPGPGPATLGSGIALLAVLAILAVPDLLRRRQQRE
jgi:hypothetical protein